MRINGVDHTRTAGEWARACGVTFDRLRERARLLGWDVALVRSIERPGHWKRGAILRPDDRRCTRAQCVTLDGVTHTTVEWARIAGVHPATMRKRLQAHGLAGLRASLSLRGVWQRTHVQAREALERARLDEGQRAA